MLAEMDEWFRKTVRAVARKWRLDPDDVYQEAALRLHTSRSIDPEHEHLLAYVRKCIHSAAHDLFAGRMETPARRDHEMSLHEQVGSDGSAADSADMTFVDGEWLRDVLAHAGLSRHQISVLLRLLRDGDMPLAEVAMLNGRSYTATRQDKSRALAGLRQALGLTKEEFDAYSGWHQGLSAAQIGTQQGLTATAVNDLLHRARHKITQLFYPERGASL
jgi:RNA polymerase sigma factor (sigma-70 family)